MLACYLCRCFDLGKVLRPLDLYSFDNFELEMLAPG